MKMPHVDDHTIRSSHSPHHGTSSSSPAEHHHNNHGQHHGERTPPRHHQSYYYDKRPSEAELSPHVNARHEAHSPHHDPHYYHHHHWRGGGDPYYNPHHHHHPPTTTTTPTHMEGSTSSSASRSAFHDTASTSSTTAPQQSSSSTTNVTTPPPSPHVHPRYDYSSYDYHQGRGGPSIPPYSQRGGYSYYHHHPHSRPPMMPMPRDMHAYPPPPYSHHPPPPHPADTMSSPPPPYTGSSAYPPPPPPHHHHYPPPRYETPPLTSGGGGGTTTSYYHDQQYPNFLPPSASMSTTGSSRSGASLVPRGADDEEYSYDSPQATGSHEEVNQVGPNDVLCGRGAPTNYHPGNEYFRDLVKQYQNTYLASKRADKPFVATHIVNIIQSRGGRFLRRYKRNGVSWERGHFVWVEVDPQKAYEKACQALREGAPEIRRKMQEANESGCSDADDNDSTTATGTATKVAVERGERIQEEELVQSNKASPGGTTKDVEDAPASDATATSTKAATAAEGEPPASCEDTRNDEMQDSERS